VDAVEKAEKLHIAAASSNAHERLFMLC
jgi:hypothetical protein